MVLRRRKWASAEGERICTSTECEHKEELQPARSFYLRKNGTLDAICKDCRKSRSKVRYAQQQARIAAQQRDYRGSPKVRRRAYDRAHRKEYHTQRYVEKREEILAKAK